MIHAGTGTEVDDGHDRAFRRSMRNERRTVEVHNEINGRTSLECTWDEHVNRLAIRSFDAARGARQRARGQPLMRARGLRHRRRVLRRRRWRDARLGIRRRDPIYGCEQEQATRPKPMHLTGPGGERLSRNLPRSLRLSSPGYRPCLCYRRAAHKSPVTQPTLLTG
jgi:hypothetical protein